MRMYVDVRPVAHNRRVGVSLAGEGDSVPLQDRARLNGQGHRRWIWKRERERDSHNKSLTASNILYAAIWRTAGCKMASVPHLAIKHLAAGRCFITI